MLLNVQLNLSLTTYPAEAQVREKPYPPNSREASICRLLNKPPVEKVLSWTRNGDARRVSLDRVIETLDKAVWGEISLVEFISQFGNFFIDTEISATQAEREIKTIWLFLTFVGMLKSRTFPAVLIEKWLLNPLKQYLEGVSQLERLLNSINKDEGFVIGNGKKIKAVTLLDVTVTEYRLTPTWIAPNEYYTWPKFRVPDKWPNTRDRIEEYLHNEILRNVMIRLRRLQINFDKKGKLKAIPFCLADALLALIVLRDNTLRPQNKTLSTYDRRVVETYFNTYCRRGKITEEQRKKAIKAVKEAWEIGERDRTTLKEIGWEAIEGYV